MGTWPAEPADTAQGRSRRREAEDEAQEILLYYVLSPEREDLLRHRRAQAFTNAKLSHSTSVAAFWESEVTRCEEAVANIEAARRLR